MDPHAAVDSDRRGSLRRHRPLLACCALCAGVAWLLASAESSVAGTYVMRNCDVPGHPPAPIGPWRAKPVGNVVLLDRCSDGGGYRFSLPDLRMMTNPSTASLRLSMPTDGRAIALAGARVWASTRLAGSGPPLRATMDVQRNASPMTLATFVSGTPASEPVTVAAFSEFEPSLQLALTCEESDRPRSGTTGATSCYPDDATPFELLGLEVTLREGVPPSGSASGGTLLGAEQVSGVGSIDYVATDGESGLARVEAVIAETVVGASDLTDKCAYADFAACPLADRGTLTVDTRKAPDGRQMLSLRVLDAAGNRYDAPVQSVVVHNGSGSVPNEGIGLPAAGAAQLSAGFGGSLRPALIVPFGRRVAVRGRLTSSSGAAVAKAQVDVLERSTVSGAKEVALGQAQTRADGRFTFQLAPRRPSRTVRLAYGSIASSPLLNVRVRAGASLKATLRGTLVRYSGRVLSRPLPRAGKLVQLEGRAPGFAWTKFATLRSDRLGRFAGRYRLRARRPGVRVQIRVRVPVERGYPYLTFTGRQVTLRVR